AARLKELLAHVRRGDPQRGQRIFLNKKFACASCHRMVFDGGDIGPALTQIGQTRNEQDLLESIVVPSATIVRGYEPWTVVTTDGQVLSGVIQRETSDAIVLTAAADKSSRIDRGDIDEMAPSLVSIMPQGLDRQLTPQQLADLVAFLKSCR
ncbi:MAG: c-type cytochrome, partial [Pirellulaceae bacterium]